MRAWALAAITLLTFGGFISRAIAQDDPREPDDSLKVERSSHHPNGLTKFVDPSAPEVPTEAMPDKFRAKVLIWLASASLIVGLTGYLTKRYDWQRLSPLMTCAHCQRIHTYAGSAALFADVVSGSALSNLIALPLMAALKGMGFQVSAIAISVLLAMAAVTVFGFLGSILNLLVPKSSQTTTSKSSMLVGIRFGGFLLSLALLSGGPKPEIVSARFASFFGYRLGERLVTAIGEAAILDTTVILFVSVTACFLIRWVVPFLAGSRPLVLTKAGDSTHRSAPLATQ